MAELDAKMIRAFHRMISNKGIAEPIAKGRGDEFDSFADALRSIAAEETQAVVSEFLALLETATAESDDPAEAITAFLKNEANALTLAGLSERYLSAAEEEQPGELLKDYLKEAKKVQ